MRRARSGSLLATVLGLLSVWSGGVGAARAEEMVLQRAGLPPCKLDLRTGHVTLPNGQIGARFHAKSGTLSWRSEDPETGEESWIEAGTVAADGEIDGQGSTGRLQKDGTLVHEETPVGRIDDKGAIYRGDEKWGEVTNCGADRDRKRFVAAFLCFCTPDFFPEPAAAPEGLAIDLVPGHPANDGQAGSCSIAADGSVSSDRGVLGVIEPDGSVRDGSGRLLGTIGEDGTIYDASAVSLGQLQDDGSLVDASGRTVGDIATDGTVTIHGTSWAYVRGLASPEQRRLVAAVVFCFYREALAKR